MSSKFLEKEILEQPQVIQKQLKEEAEPIARIAQALRGSFHYVVIAARGTSDNAARYAQYLFGAYNRLPVALATPSLYTLYGQPPSLVGALVIGISQSGQSPDIIEVISEARRQGRPTITVTNDTQSPLAKAAEHIINLHAGDEKAVAATKTYTSSLCALAMFSCSLDGSTERFEQLKRLPEHMEQTLKGLHPVLSRVERYRYMSNCAMVGRGFNYATVFEIALKVKELTRVVATPYSTADFRHGPIAMVSDGFPVLVVAPSSQLSGDVEEMVSELESLDSELLIISDKKSLLEKAQLAFPIPGGIPEWLTPPVAVLPGQLLAMELAAAKGFDPDRPKGLHKVTETL
jgi:glucosamine--fructose-6-phosphate aminotransferase (isomerizing)